MNHSLTAVTKVIISSRVRNSLQMQRAPSYSWLILEVEYILSFFLAER